MKKISSLERSLNRSARVCLPVLVTIGVAFAIGLSWASRTPSEPLQSEPTGASCTAIVAGTPPPTLGPVTVKATAGVLGPTDYMTVKAAFDAINAGTHQGLITMWILGNTVETASAVLNASGTGGASYASILMLPSGARTISGTLAAPLIDLNGADCVSIDGVGTGGNSLTISNASTSNTTGTSTIRFINGAQNDTVTNCTLRGSALNTVAFPCGTVLFSTTTSVGNSFNTISHNDIGPAGSNLPVKAVEAIGTTTNANTVNQANVIDSNNIFDFFITGTNAITAGIDIQAGNTNWTISNNRLYQTAPRTFAGSVGVYRGIWINGTIGATGDFHTIIGNIIGFANANGTGTTTVTGGENQFRGIFVSAASNGTPTVIQGNTISGIDYSTNFTGGFSGAAGFIGIDTIGVNFQSSGLFNYSGNTIGSLDGSSTIAVHSTSTASSFGWIVSGIRGTNTPSTISANQIGAITINTVVVGAGIGFRGIEFNSGVPVTISDNVIGGPGPGGAIIDNATGNFGSYEVDGILAPNCDGSVTGNTVRNISSSQTGSSMFGIQFGANGTFASTISENVIHSLTSGSHVIGTQAQFGLLPNRIERNFIHSLNSTSIHTSIFGMYLPGNANSVVANNMVQLGLDSTGNSITASHDMFGIQDQNSGTREYYFNSVFVGGSGVVNADQDTYAFGNFNNGTRIFKNNVFWNARSNASGGAKNYAILTATSPLPSSDYNDLYVTGTGGVLGRYNGVDRLTLADWQAATGQDAHSISMNPQFINPTGNANNVDLHILNASPCVSAGITISGITVDFDGDPRANPPAIGADEPCSSVRAYISNRDSNNVSVIDTSTNTVVTTVAVGTAPSGVAVKPDGTRAYVTNTNSNNLSVINTSNNTVMTTVAVGTAPRGVAVKPDGARAYVTNSSSNTLSVVDTSNNTVVATVPLGSGPFGVTVKPDGTRAYVTNVNDNNVSVIDTSNNTVLTTVGVGSTPRGIAVKPDGTRVYVANGFGNSVSVIDTSTNTVVGTIPLPNGPTGVAVKPDGTRVYVTNGISGVSVIDTSTDTVLTTVTVGNGPVGLAVRPDGSRVYVANQISNNVKAIDTSDNTVVATVAVGSGPTAFGNFIVNVPCSSPTPTPTPTATASATFTPTPTATATFTPTPTATATFSPTATPTATFTPTATATATFTVTPTPTAAASATATPTPTPLRPSPTPTPTATATPSSTPFNCVRGRGYWKNHAEWPVNQLELGNVTYNRQQLQSILETEVRFNGLVSLAHQEITAKLNIANGADGSCISQTLAGADALIGDLVVPPVGDGFLSTRQAAFYVNTLTNYNEGYLCSPSCVPHPSPAGTPRPRPTIPPRP